MKKIAIVSALYEETKFIHEYIENRNGWNEIDENFYENTKKDILLYVKVLGVGKVNAAYQTADLINDFHPDLIVNIGVSGGLHKEAKRGTIAIGKSYVQTDLHPYLEVNFPRIDDTSDTVVEGIERIAKKKGYSYLTGKLATGDFFLNDPIEKKRIIDEYNPISFDMETAAIAQVATAKDIEFVGIRIFSDLADADAIENFKVKDLSKREIGLREKLQKQPTKLVINYLEEELAMI